jgi:hypothetical protein
MKKKTIKLAFESFIRKFRVIFPYQGVPPTRPSNEPVSQGMTGNVPGGFSGSDMSGIIKRHIERHTDGKK